MITVSQLMHTYDLLNGIRERYGNSISRLINKTDGYGALSHETAYAYNLSEILLSEIRKFKQCRNPIVVWWFRNMLRDCGALADRVTSEVNTITSFIEKSRKAKVAPEDLEALYDIVWSEP